MKYTRFFEYNTKGDTANEKGQSNRLTMQQKEGQGPVTIFHKDAQIHDAEVGNTSLFVKNS